MKTSLFLIATVASLLPTLAMGTVAIPWSISNAPSSGLNDITFPFSIAKSPHKTGYYFAQQFNFNGQADIGYTGLQPRPDSNGNPIIHATFSSFIAGTTTSDKNCSPGADGGPGVSCSVEFSGPYADTYDIEIRNVGGTTWEGAVVDVVSGLRVHIGSYTLPAGTGAILGSRDGFLEHYLGSQVCAQWLYTSVVFGAPKTSMSGVGVGSLGDAYEYGDCAGQQGYKVERTEFGLDISVGFK